MTKKLCLGTHILSIVFLLLASLVFGAGVITSKLVYFLVMMGYGWGVFTAHLIMPSKR